MNSVERESDDLLSAIWSSAGEDLQVVGELRSHVARTAADHSDPLTCARVIAALTLLPETPAWKARLEPFVNRTAHLLNRSRQVDQLGDPATPVQAVFEILGDEIEGIDMTKFDAQKLSGSRTGKSRPEAAMALLEALDLASTNPDAAAELSQVASRMTHRDRFGCAAMFGGPKAIGHTLGVQASEAKGSPVGFNDADEAMARQAQAALALAYEGRPGSWMIEWPVAFGGDSIGLPLWIAAQVSRDWGEDPLLAATGMLDPSGRVCRVGQIEAKVTAAATSGFRRIVVPSDNMEQATETLAKLKLAGPEVSEAVELIGVGHVSEVREALARVSTSAALGLDGMVRLLRNCLPIYGLALIEEEPLKDRHRLAVTDSTELAHIDIAHNKKATVTAGGKGSALAAAQRLIDEQLPADRIQSRQPLSVVIPPDARRVQLLETITKNGALEVPIKSEYETFRYLLNDAGSTAHLIGYKSHKVVLQGNAPAWDRLAADLTGALQGLAGATELAAKIAQEQASSPETVAATPGRVSAPNPGTGSGSTALSAGYVTHIGTDEAGKGDYFGPLVCAACYVDADNASALDKAGVRDSKRLSDNSVRRLAALIRELMPGSWAVVPINPPRYNTMQEQMKAEGQGLNSMVAWGHQKGIRQLMDHGRWAEYVVIDKFADQKYIEERLDEKARRGMRLDMRPKAESDIAVAAASILARDRFLEWLEKESRDLGMPLPKGAGPPVIEAARNLVAAHGREALDKYAKVSFKTTRTVLELT